MFNWEDLGKTIGGIGDVVKDGFGIYDSIANRNKASKQIASDTVAAQPAVNLNITPSDLGFQPNWYLIGSGVVALILIAMLKK